MDSARTTLKDALTASSLDKPQRPSPDKRITLQHTVSLSQAKRYIAKSQKIKHVTVDANGLIGGIASTSGAALNNSDIDRLEQYFLDNFGRAPVLSSVDVNQTSQDQDSQELSAGLNSLPRVTPDHSAPLRIPQPPPGFSADNPSMSETSASTRSVTPMGGVNGLAHHFPSSWYGMAGGALDYENNNTRNWFRWSSYYGADPLLTPPDWGMEIGFTLWNDELTGTRPNCFDATRSFWAYTWEIGGIWVTNLPASTQPYPDTNIWSDPCAANGLELGIGEPRNVQKETAYFLQSTTTSGGSRHPFSVFSASMGLVSNDCNDIGQSANSNCMGLNTGRNPGVVPSELLTSKARNWTVPGCSELVSGWANPVYHPTGQSGCQGRF